MTNGKGMLGNNGNTLLPHPHVRPERTPLLTTAPFLPQAHQDLPEETRHLSHEGKPRLLEACCGNLSSPGTWRNNLALDKMDSEERTFLET